MNKIFLNATTFVRAYVTITTPTDFAVRCYNSDDAQTFYVRNNSEGFTYVTYKKL